MKTGPARRRIIVGITGASGAIYAVRTMRALLLEGFEIHLVVSHYGERLLAGEAGIRLGKEGLEEIFIRGAPAAGEPGDDVPARAARRSEERAPAVGSIIRHGINDLGAPISSGSFQTAGMVVVPCTTKTLAGIALGLSGNLIERAADVCLKEKRAVVLVVREAPLSLVHLRNMVAATEAGAVVVPASPGFYQKPETFDDLADFIAGRVLNLFGLEQRLFRPWGESE